MPNRFQNVYDIAPCVLQCSIITLHGIRLFNHMEEVGYRALSNPDLKFSWQKRKLNCYLQMVITAAGVVRVSRERTVTKIERASCIRNDPRGYLRPLGLAIDRKCTEMG